MKSSIALFYKKIMKHNITDVMHLINQISAPGPEKHWTKCCDAQTAYNLIAQTSYEIKHRYAATLLALAAIYESEKIRNLIPFPIDQYNDNNQDGTALILSIIPHQTQAVKFLIKHEADVNLPDKAGNLALQTSLFFHYHDISTILLQAGANPNLFAKSSNSALDMIANSLLTAIESNRIVEFNLDYHFYSISSQLIQAGANPYIKMNSSHSAFEQVNYFYTIIKPHINASPLLLQSTALTKDELNLVTIYHVCKKLLEIFKQAKNIH